jgi:heat-inducible transcriptional repressor
MQEARETMNQIMLDAVQVAEAAIAPMPDEKLEYVIAGETNLMGVADLASVDKLKRLFEAFNERRDFLTLLDGSLKALRRIVFQPLSQRLTPRRTVHQPVWHSAGS